MERERNLWIPFCTGKICQLREGVILCSKLYVMDGGDSSTTADANIIIIDLYPMIFLVLARAALIHRNQF